MDEGAVKKLADLKAENESLIRSQAQVQHRRCVNGTHAKQNYQDFMDMTRQNKASEQRIAELTSQCGQERACGNTDALQAGGEQEGG